MRIAIASTDGKNVNEHFGKTKEFLIFDLSATEPEFIERRKVLPLSVEDKNHDFDEVRFGAVMANISDCKRVYVTKIGDKPAEELRRHGIMPVIFDAAIADICT